MNSFMEKFGMIRLSMTSLGSQKMKLISLKRQQKTMIVFLKKKEINILK